MDANHRKRVVVGLPGRSFSDRFLLAWTQLIFHISSTNNYDLVISPGSSSFVPFARMQTLGLNVLRGADQKPFDDIAYDVFVTLDSDIVFKPEQFIALVEGTERYPVFSGVYKMADGVHYATVREWDYTYFTMHGRFPFLTDADVGAGAGAGEPFPVAYSGMGFFACRKEVLNALKYPYFWAPLQTFTAPDGTVVTEQVSEDVAFCKNIVAAGYQVVVDTSLRVGHEKTMLL